MNGAEYHLIVNHIPIFSVAFGVCILIWGMIKNSKSIKQIAAVLFVLGALSSYVAVETGHAAEEVVEDIPTVTHHLIEEHEESAETSLWLSIALGVLSLIWLFADNLNLTFKKPLLIVTLILGLVSVGSLIYTAYLGGHIRHTEIRPNQTAVPNTNMDHDSD
ncbi:MAG TPA: hypothetical protein VJ964_12190 [Balneolaceae bacterium]|nr:hypothetical protein [Balneolaceae bacterium]